MPYFIWNNLNWYYEKSENGSNLEASWVSGLTYNSTINLSSSFNVGSRGQIQGGVISFVSLETVNLGLRDFDKVKIVSDLYVRVDGRQSSASVAVTITDGVINASAAFGISVSNSAGEEVTKQNSTQDITIIKRSDDLYSITDVTGRSVSIDTSILDKTRKWDIFINVRAHSPALLTYGRAEMKIWDIILTRPPEGFAAIVSKSVPSSAKEGDLVGVGFSIKNVGGNDDIFVELVDDDTGLLVNSKDYFLNENQIKTDNINFTMPNKIINLKLNVGHK